MALTATDLDAITQAFIQPQIADNIFNAAPAWARIWKMRKVYTGLQTRLPVEFQRNDQTTAFTGTAPRNLDNQEFITDARFDLKEYTAPMSVTDRQVAQNSGKEAIVSYVQATQANAEKTLTDTLETDFWGTSSDDPANQTIEGALDILSSTSTYGGIAVADFANWIAQIDATTTTLSIREILNLYQDTTEGVNSPTVAHVTKPLFARFTSLLQTQQRFMDANKASAGFPTVMFLGLPVIMSSFVPGTGGGTQDSFWTFFNENFLNLFVSREFQAKIGPWKDMKPEEPFMATSVELKASYGVNNRRFQGAMTNLDPDL